MREKEHRTAEHPPLTGVQYGWGGHMLLSLSKQCRQGRREREAGREGEKDNTFLLGRKALPRVSRILAFLNVSTLVAFEFPVLILTKLETRRKAKISGLPTEMVSES